MERAQTSIRAVATASSDVNPQRSTAISRMRQLCSEGRYLAARQECENAGISIASADLTTADRSVVELVLHRCAESEKALASTEGSDWTVGSESNGIKTTYRRESDDSISICTEGIISCNSLFFFFLPLD